MVATEIVILAGLLIFVSHLFAVLFEKKGIPDVLLLMILGIIMGPVLHLVDPNSLGVISNVFTTITLVIILFEGGLDLKIETVRSALKGTTLLTHISFFATTLVVGLIGWLLLKMEPIPAFCLGAILGGTSSAVVIPMVAQLKLQTDSKTILVLESALSDVLCIVFVLALVEAWGAEGINIGAIIGNILSSFILAALLGIAAALFWSLMLTRIRRLQNSMFITPAFLFVIYGIAELLGFSGAIAALAFGVSLANINKFNLKAIKRLSQQELQTFDENERKFFAEFGFILKTFFFLFIGLSIQFSNIWAIMLGFFITVIIYAIRIPVVRLSIDSPLPKEDLTIMATMVPKGLAAAVLASIPLQYGMPGSEMIRDITYAVILTSIVFTSIIIPAIKRFPSIINFYGALLVRRSNTVALRENGAPTTTPMNDRTAHHTDASNEPSGHSDPYERS